MSMEDQLVGEIKPFVQAGKLESLQILWEDYSEHTDFGRPIAWDYVFQKIYLHAALHKQHAICQWLDSLYADFNEMTKIAIRQMFPYARYLLRR